MVIMTETVGPSSPREARRGFTTRALLSSVAAWMDAHPLTAPLIDSVNLHAMAGVGSDVMLHVTGSEVELGIMLDAFDRPRGSQQMRDCHAPADQYRSERWWRQGSFLTDLPNGEKWSVTVTVDLPAGVTLQDCGNCDGGHTGDAYCSQSTAGLLSGGAS